MQEKSKPLPYLSVSQLSILKFISISISTAGMCMQPMDDDLS